MAVMECKKLPLLIPERMIKHCAFCFACKNESQAYCLTVLPFPPLLAAIPLALSSSSLSFTSLSFTSLSSTSISLTSLSFTFGR